MMVQAQDLVKTRENHYEIFMAIVEPIQIESVFFHLKLMMDSCIIIAKEIQAGPVVEKTQITELSKNWWNFSSKVTNHCYICIMKTFIFSVVENYE